jgi:hypothetical protein
MYGFRGLADDSVPANPTLQSPKKVTSRAPSGTLPACAKRAAYSDPPPVVPHPESLAAQAAYNEALLPGAPARIVSRHWGPPRACYRVPYCE